MDLSQDYNILYIKLMTEYDKLVGLGDYNNARADEHLFTIASSNTNEFSYKGSYRAFLTRRYYSLDIRRNFGITLSEWFSQDLAETYRLIAQLPELLAEREEILSKLNQEDK